VTDLLLSIFDHPAFWPLTIALLTSWSFYRNWRYEKTVAQGGRAKRSVPGRLTQAGYPFVLTLFFALFYLLLLLQERRSPKALLDALIELALPLALLIVVYFTLVLLILPLLRRHISALACATLWGLPTAVAFFQLVCRSHVRPTLVLRLPSGVAPWLMGVWLAGTAAVLGWKVLAHLRFRRNILKDARPVEDEHILALWAAEQARIEREQPIDLLISPAISSPLTVGLFSLTMKTLLPERDYTEEELKLIFRHELRHVQRRDVDSKAFYIFCQALCWFDPLVWLAADRACADLEFSCDEMVLYSADEGTRRRYAGLLLTGAENDTGLTTCLSASGEALRRRLQAVVAPPARRSSGALLLGVAAALLILCSDQVAFSTQQGTVEEVILSRYEDYFDPRDWERSALRQTLGEIPVSRVSTLRGAGLRDSPGGFQLYLHSGAGQLSLTLFKEGYLEVWDTTRTGNTSHRTLYTIDGPVDYPQLKELWEELKGMPYNYTYDFVKAAGY